MATAFLPQFLVAPAGFGWQAMGRSNETRGALREVTKLGSPASERAPSDESLVIAAREGGQWAFEALFRRHANMAFGLAFRLLPRDGDVDDIVQDAFSIAFERLPSLQNPQAFAAWLGSIVVNTVSKRLRRRRLLERLGLSSAELYDPDQVVSPVAPVEVAIELKAIYRVLQGLPPQERVALVLRRVEGLEIAQIAEYMKTSQSTVKRRLMAAEARLGRARTR